MKKLFISLALVGAVTFAGSNALADCGCAGQMKTVKTPFYYYLNPLQYVGIGNNYSSFSLNPLTGFKNCDRATVKKCDECTKVQPCPSCKRAFLNHNCDSCDRAYIETIQPRCTSCGK